MAKGRVSIVVERCKACGFCVEFCPLHVLALSSAFNSKGYHPTHVVHPEKCSGCVAVGKFVDRDRPDYQTMMRAQYVESLGDRYIEEPEMEASFTELNLKAFDKGYKYGLTVKAGAPPEPEEVGYAQE